MKIAIFSDIYTPSGAGGIVASIRAQKAELERLGHEVTVFCPGHKTTEKGVVLVPSHKKLTINGAVISLRPWIVEEFVLQKFPDFPFDLVHVHYEASCSIAGIRLAKRFKVPLVQTMHGREDMAITMNVPHFLKLATAEALGVLHRKCLPHKMKVRKDKFQAPTLTRAKMWELMVNHAEQADVVVTPSDHLAKKLEHYGVSRPISVVPNGIQDDLVAQDFQERKMVEGDVLKMVWNSRVSQEKRIMPFLQAVARLKRPYVLYVYGDGNTLKAARKYAEKHRLKVKFYGAVPREKILARMREAHLSVLASYNFDVHGLVLVEAEATGLPVFLCDPTLMEVIPMGGFVLSGGPEPEAMAIALDKMKPEQIQAMSKVMMKNRHEVMESEQIKKMLAVYKQAQAECKKRK